MHNMEETDFYLVYHSVARGAAREVTRLLHRHSRMTFLPDMLA